MSKQKSIKQYVFHYKNGNIIPDLDCYVHIWAGKNSRIADTKLLGDDTGDNISIKNKYYSELTGIYWIWKNEKSDIVGTSHYRRFFTDSKVSLFQKIKSSLYWTIGLKRKRHGLFYTSNKKYWLR